VEDMSYRHVQNLASSNSYNIELPVIDCPLISASHNWISGSAVKVPGSHQVRLTLLTRALVFN